MTSNGPADVSTLWSGAAFRESGFTLVEILAVITIIGIALMTAFMSLENLTPKHRLRSESRKVGSVIRRARNHAIRKGTFVEISYETEQDRILLFPARQSDYLKKTDDRRSFDDEEDTKQDREPLYSYNLPTYINLKDAVVQSDDRFREEGGKLLVGPQGFVRPHVVYLTGEEEQKMTVLPNPLTGSIRYRYGHENEDTVMKDERSSLR